MAVPRDVIDARGSFDSRTFSEDNRISHTSKDERDRPRAAIDTSMSTTRWHSRAGNGFKDYSTPRPMALGGTRNRYPVQRSGIPTVLKVAIPVVVIAIIIAVFFL